MAEKIRTTDGRVAGKRAEVTRQKLLECLAQALHTSAYRDIKVTDIARAAGTSPATFYQYFPDIETAVLDIAGDMAEDGDRLRRLVAGQPWRGKSAYPTTEHLVDGFLGFWKQYEPVLRVVDLATSEGDDRFRRIRVQMLNNIVNALAGVMVELSPDGPSKEKAVAMSSVLVSMLAQVAGHQRGFVAWGIDVGGARESMVELVYWGVTGKKPPRP